MPKATPSASSKPISTNRDFGSANISLETIPARYRTTRIEKYTSTYLQGTSEQFPAIRNQLYKANTEAYTENMHFLNTELYRGVAYHKVSVTLCLTHQNGKTV
jgi:hypothetical protein